MITSAFEIFKNELPEMVEEKITELSWAQRLLIFAYKLELELMGYYGFSWQVAGTKMELKAINDELQRFLLLKKRLESPYLGSNLTIQAFKLRYPMIETAKEYLSLNYQHMAICPFHKDTQRSLKIYEDHYHCFGCQAHGDVLNFIMKIKDISLRELLKEKI